MFIPQWQDAGGIISMELYGSKGGDVCTSQKGTGGIPLAGPANRNLRYPLGEAWCFI